MFKLFRPRCPVDVQEKTWTELAMKWLVDALGHKRLLEAVVVEPTAEFFPEPFTPTEGAIRALVARVCGWMQVNPAGFDLEITSDAASDAMLKMTGHSWDTAGVYESSGDRPMISISESRLGDRDAFVATLAHEVSREILLGGELMSGGEIDYEECTDLTPLVLGMGVFAANTVLEETNEQSLGWYSWRMRRHGNLPARIHGYAFALFAWLRNEDSPAWARWLRPDVRVAFDLGSKFLRKTGDSRIRPDNVDRPDPEISELRLIDELRTGSPGARLSAMWMVCSKEARGDGWSEDAVHAVVAQFRDSEAIIRGEAARIVGTMGPAAVDALDDLRLLADDSSDRVRASVAESLAHIPADQSEVVPEIIRLLIDPRRSVSVSAAYSLSAVGVIADDAGRPLVKRLFDAVVKCRHEDAELMADTMLVVLSDPEAEVERHASGNDDEICVRALELLEERRMQAAEAATASV